MTSHAKVHPNKVAQVLANRVPPRRVIIQYSYTIGVIVLNNQERDRLLDELDNPSPPTPELLALFAR